MISKDALKNRIAKLRCNNRIGSRDIANQEILEIAMFLENHIVKDLERLEELEKENEKLSIENDELLDNKLELVVKNKQQDIFIEKLIQANEMLKITILEYKSQQELFWETSTNNANLRKENQELKERLSKYE